jgi:D-alanyl-D-alanine dipeptidase
MHKTDTIDLQNKPIPDLTDVHNRKQGYRNHPIDTNHQLYSEDFADVRDYNLSGDNYYHLTNNPPYNHQIPHSIPDLLLRISVINKLRAINTKLNSIGLELYFFDCYRPIEVQNYFHDIWVPEYLKKLYPDWNEATVSSEVDKYWAKGAPSSLAVDMNSPPPHSTGAAFDVTIRHLSGEHLFMGSAFDDPSEISNTDYFEKQSSRQHLSASKNQALQNRRLLYWLMIDSNFCNNPTEWWHYSYGDQMWAKINMQPAAIYSKLNFD